MQKLFSAGSYIEAQLIRGYLEQAGIEVQIVNENSSGTPGTPHWALPVAAEIWVMNDSQKQEAERLLQEYFANQAGDAGTDWACGQCNEMNPGSFDVCWNCSAARP